VIDNLFVCILKIKQAQFPERKHLFISLSVFCFSDAEISDSYCNREKMKTKAE